MNQAMMVARPSPPPSPRISFRHSAGLRSLEALNAVPYIPLEFRPAERSTIDITIEGANGVGMHFWRTTTRSGFRSLPQHHRDVFTLRLPERGALQRRNFRQDYDCRPGEAMLLSFEEMQDFRAGPDLDVLSATFSRPGLIACRDTLHGSPVATPLAFVPVVSLTTPGVAALAHMVGSLHKRFMAGFDPADLSLPLIEEMFFCHLLTVWPQTPTPPTPFVAEPRRSVALAIDFIDANLSRQITIGDVARAAQLGVRALQIAFRREIGATPLQYLIARRLDRVHRDLKHAPSAETTASIAGRWGFTHASDFSRRYRERFGVTPSETRRAPRGR